MNTLLRVGPGGRTRRWSWRSSRRHRCTFG